MSVEAIVPSGRDLELIPSRIIAAIVSSESEMEAKVIRLVSAAGRRAFRAPASAVAAYWEAARALALRSAQSLRRRTRNKARPKTRLQTS